MAITDSTVFDEVRISCNCDQIEVYDIRPYNNGTSAVGAESIRPTTTDSAQIAQLDIMRDAVIAGTAAINYRDEGVQIPYDDLPFEHQLVHTLHSIHPDTGWKATATLVRNADVTEDDDTGRSDLSTQFGIVPEKRQPDGDTYNYPLDGWSIRLIAGTDIEFTRDWTTDDNVTAPNTHDDVIGMFAWLEANRVSGSGTAFGDSILTIGDLSGRTVALDQGTGHDVLDLHVTSIGSQVTGGVYSHVSFTLQRITGETDAIDIAAIRAVFMDAVGSITVESDDAPEAPPFGSTEIGIRAAYIELPDGKRIEPVEERIVLRQPSLGRTPLDGSGRRIVRYDDLEDISTAKYMPDDGARVVHFGHGATAHGDLVFRSVAEHTLSENIGEVYEVRNISDEHDVEVHVPWPNSGTLINLKPGQQCAFELSEENADGDEEIIAINPPERRVEWQRGLALPSFDGMQLYSADSTGWLSLPWGTNVVKYRDIDGFSLGNATRPTEALMSNIDAADWDIPGSFAIVNGGVVTLDLRYHLLLDADPPTDLEAVLVLGHGISLWISEGGTETLTRQGYVGLPEISAIGDIADCNFRYTGAHSAGTRFLMLHRIPTGSVLGTAEDVDAYYGQIDLEAITSNAELRPIIRWTSS